jgi:chemotaxis protein MotB
MAREKEKKEDDGPKGAPEWMVTFSDCMTLLLTFFVLLLSFSTFGPDKLTDLGKIFREAMPASGVAKPSSESTVWESVQFQNVEKLAEGTEARSDSEDKNDSYMIEKKPLDFRNLKVFSIPSDKVFWGNGTAITKDAKEMLDSLAKYINRMPSRLVVSENGPGTNQNIGFARALTIIKYMSENGGVKEDRIGISASSTVIKKRLQGQRMVEITLLDRNVYQ